MRAVGEVQYQGYGGRRELSARVDDDVGVILGRMGEGAAQPGAVGTGEGGAMVVGELVADLADALQIMELVRGDQSHCFRRGHPRRERAQGGVESFQQARGASALDEEGSNVSPSCRSR